MSADLAIVDYYARRAHQYERIYQKPERQQELTRLRSALEQKFAGHDVLEIASGTGYWTEVIARRAASVTAVDLNDKVLEIARAKPLDHRKVTFARADAYALPEFPRRFTAGLAAFWWSHVPKSRLRGFLAQWHRAYEPGATLLVMDNAYAEGSSTPIAFKDTEGNTYQTRQLDDGSTHDVLKNFPTADELRATVDELATDVEIEFSRYYWRMTYVPRAH